MRFTQSTVKTIEIPAEKLKRSFPEHIVFDDDMPGFGVRVLPGRGEEPHRSYIAQYKLGQKHRRMTIGNVLKLSLEDARKEAKKIFGDVAYGIDPADEKKKVRGQAGDTFDAAIKEYLAVQEKELRPRSYTEIERHLNEDWKSLHGMALASIEGADIGRQLAVFAKRGNTVANRARALSFRLLSLGDRGEQGWRQPAKPRRRVRQKEGGLPRSGANRSRIGRHLACLYR